MKTRNLLCVCLSLLAGTSAAEPIEANWDSMAANYEVPDWFRDGKVGVWMHWGISSAADEERPPDGSHYGCRMYGTEGYDAANEPDKQRTAALTEWHTKPRCRELIENVPLLGSPALALGIEALDVSRMGRLNPEQSQDEGALLISDGSRFVPGDHFPRFSWEVTPQYFMFGDTQRLLQPDEVRSIAARTDFLCIEKSHGLRTLGAAELGARHEAASFRAIKPGIKVLFYFNSAYAYPFTSYSKALTRDKIDRHPELKEFLLVDPETGELAHRRNVFFFDALNPELREWWASTVAKGVSDSGCDGAFIDQMHGFAWLRPGKGAEVQKAMGEMMALLKRKMGPDKILLGNNANQNIARDVFPVIDASMFEHYNEKLLSKENLLQDWEDMLRIAKAGKMSVFRIGVESDPAPVKNADRRAGTRNRDERLAALARERLEYYLACYLIGAQPYSYFQYGWGWTLSSGSLQDYPELHKPLGAPKGPYTRIAPDAWEFSREFEHASVWVDTENGRGRITWR